MLSIGFQGISLRHSENLRDRLRADTRAAHDRVDAAYQACDFASVEGLGFFLSDHLSAYGTLSLDDPEASRLRDEYCAALRGDLRALGYPARGAAPSLPVRREAALYIMLGSRRGAQMVRRQWAAKARGRAGLAGAFLSLDPRNDEWRQFCADLALRPPDGPDADRIVADTCAIFDLFDARSSDVSEQNHV